jgi:hypothetical protein
MYLLCSVLSSVNEQEIWALFGHKRSKPKCSDSPPPPKIGQWLLHAHFFVWQHVPAWDGKLSKMRRDSMDGRTGCNTGCGLLGDRITTEGDSTVRYWPHLLPRVRSHFVQSATRETISSTRRANRINNRSFLRYQLQTYTTHVDKTVTAWIFEGGI